MKKQLGNYEFVDDYVRHFALRVFNVMSNATSDNNAAIAETQKICNEAGRVFAGQVKGYEIVPGWNPEGLVQSLRECIDEPTDEKVIEVVFRLFVLRLWKFVEENAPGEVVVAEIEALSKLLVGIDFDWLFERHKEEEAFHASGISGPREHDVHWHPQVNDKGERVNIQHPTQPTNPATWTNKAAIATFVPSGDVPLELTHKSEI